MLARRPWWSSQAVRAPSTWTWVAIALLVCGLALPGCQEMGDDGATASSGTAPAEEPAAAAEYPLLQSVPPRPQLSYTIQQQREIVEALIADRENARYTSQVVRHRSGLSSLPPPPAPPEPAAPVSIEPAIAARAPAPRLDEQETFIDFLAALLFDEPIEGPVAEPAPPDRPDEPEELGSVTPQALPEGSEPAPASSADASDPSPHEPRRAPLPPPQSAVAARLVAVPDVIDALLDATVPQAPLPPGQSALAARLAVAEQNARAAPPPVPARRPATVRSADAVLPAPPPLKPILPVDAVPPRPVEKPADFRSAAAHGRSGGETASADGGARAVRAAAAAAG